MFQRHQARFLLIFPHNNGQNTVVAYAAGKQNKENKILWI